MSAGNGAAIFVSSPEKSLNEPVLNNSGNLAPSQDRQSSVLSVESNNSYQARIEESISNPFPIFAHTDLLARPYDQELKRDVEFAERMF